MTEDLKNSVIFDRGELNPYGKYFTGTSYLNMLKSRRGRYGKRHLRTGLH